MILFLEVISPIPKFVIIDNNKVIESLYILDKNNTKISDCIHDKFSILQKKYILLDILDCLIVCTGPGSYTSLRVGISFMLGISYSKKIPLYGISCAELLSKFIMVEDFYHTLVVICSANNQNYIFLPVSHKDYHYKILKINDIYSIENIDLTLYSKCISNSNLPYFLNKLVCSTIKQLEYIKFEDKLNKDFLIISNNETILQPIYISNNKLFN